MAKAKVITVDEVKYLRDKLVGGGEEAGEYGGVHQQFEEDDKFHELGFRELLGVPTQFEDDATVLPTARQLIDVYTDHVDLANARVSVSQKSVNEDDPKAVEKAEEEADLLAKFGRGILYRSNVEEDISQLRVAAKHQGLYGLGCIKTVYDADRWLDKPEQGENESDSEYNDKIDEWRNERDSQMPIVLQAVNPRNIYPDPSYSGRQFVIEVREKILLDVRDRYPSWSNPLGRKIDGRVKLTSCWTNDRRCELADDEPLLPVRGGVAKHKYGFVPYVFIESGLGNLSYDGDLAKRYVGILRYLRGVLISESRNFSIYDVAMKKGALPWYTGSGDNIDQMVAFKAGYGDVVKLPAGVKLDKQTPDLAPDAVMRQVEIINGIIMAFAAPRATQGLGETGVRSAAHARTLADLGGVRFQYPSESFRNKVAKILSNCALIYKNVVPDNLRVWAKTPSDEFDMIIDKTKLHPPFTFYVEFAPTSAEADYVKNDANMKLHHEGIVDAKWVRKQMSNVDWRQMGKEEEKRKVEADPAVQQQLGQLRSAMITAAVQNKMMEEQIKMPQPTIPPVGQGESSFVPGAEGAGRSIVAPSSPKPIPGSVANIDNQLAALRGPSITMQGQGGGGNRG